MDGTGARGVPHAYFFDKDEKLVHECHPLDGATPKLLDYFETGKLPGQANASANQSRKAMTTQNNNSKTKIVGSPRNDLEKHLIKYDLLNSASRYKSGQPLMLVSFAVLSPQSLEAIPFLVDFQQKFPNVYQVSVDGLDDRDVLEQLMEILDVMQGMNVAFDGTGDLKQLMEETDVEDVPHAYYFDPDGKLLWHGHPLEERALLLLVALNEL